jgi:hypothetical protein
MPLQGIPKRHLSFTNSKPQGNVMSESRTLCHTISVSITEPDGTVRKIVIYEGQDDTDAEKTYTSLCDNLKRQEASGIGEWTVPDETLNNEQERFTESTNVDGFKMTVLWFWELY